MAVEDCIRYPDSCILIMGPTLKQTREIVTPRIKLLMRDAPEGFIRPSKSEGKWYIGDSELVIGGFDIHSGSQRGKTVQNIYIEEVVDSHPDAYLDSMRSDLGPALTHSKAGRMIFLTTPPKIPDHPFLTETVPQAKLSGNFHCYTIDENTQLTPQQYERCVTLAGGKDSIDFRREYMCEIVRDPSITVVPHFDPAKHVGDYGLSQASFFQVAMDWGGVRDHTVALLHSYDFLSNTDLILDERVFPPNTATSTILEGVREMEKGRLIHMRWIDAPPQLVSIDLAAMNYTAHVPLKDDWQAAVNNMALKFTLNNIIIDRKCKFLIQTLQSGTFNKTKNDFERTQTLGHCDALAALMYGIRHMDRSNPFPSIQVPGGISHSRFREEKIEVPYLTKRLGTFK